MSGTLYLVATPIGNLEDITYRAVRILGEVDRIACEDTRHTGRLLEHYGVRTPMISYHEHNEQARTADLIARLEAGENIALVSDAGTPLVSDPGYRMVHAAMDRGLKVVPIPGASAVLAALTASGLPTDAFHFAGFLPAKQGARRRALEELKELDCTLVVYEAPHRILETLADVGVTLGERPAVLTRELTKLHEEFLRGTPGELATQLSSRPAIKGEMTLVIGKPLPRPADSTSIPKAVAALVSTGMPRMEAMKTIARERGLSKREVYSAVEAENPEDNDGSG